MKTLNELYKEFMHHHRVLLREHTLESYKSIYEVHLEPRYSNLFINDLKFGNWQDLVVILSDKGKKPKTISNIIKFVSSMYSHAIRLEYIKHNPIEYVQIPSFDNRRYFNYSLETQKRIIKAIKEFNEPIYKDIFFFLLHGRRLNEVLCMEWNMIDFELNQYVVPASINKAKRNMNYEMTKELRERFIALYESQSEYFDKDYLEGYVFLNYKTNKHFVDIRKPWNRLKKEFGLPENLRVHDIRHLIGSYTQNYLDLPTIKVKHTLGHINIETTLRYITDSPKNGCD